MVYKAAILIGTVVVACAFSGCASLILKHSPLPAAGTSIGVVSLVVNNTRAKDEGGEDPMLVGCKRSAVGIPFKLEADNNVIDAVKAVQVDALASAGYKVVDGARIQVVVDVNRFFMNGYMGYKIDVACGIRAMAGETTALEKTITDSLGFSYMTERSIYVAFDTLMNRVACSSLAVYNSPEFQAAVK